MQGFARLSAAVPRCVVADVSANCAATLALWRRADAEGSQLVVFPELGLSSYSARDLLHDASLLAACREGLSWLAEQGKGLRPLALVGLPLRVGGGLYNVAAALQGGRLLAVVPKSYLPAQREFEERRWFRSGLAVPPASTLQWDGREVPFGTDLLLRAGGQADLVVGVELCEDLWVALPPSAFQVGAGATVICNLSASNATVGKAELRRLLARSASDRGKCAYVYVGAGPGESSTDVVFDADAFICEDGRVLVNSQRFVREGQCLTTDIDLELLQQERLRSSSFGDCAEQHARSFRSVAFRAQAPTAPLRRMVTPHPFLPADATALAERCSDIFSIQTQGLVTRVLAAGSERLILGLSGGVDSTQAALVAAAALDELGVPRAQLEAVLLPGLGTSSRTSANSKALALALGATTRELDISESTRLVLSATEHPALAGIASAEALIERLREQPALGDAALENAQARLRTLLLMTLANQHHGLVVGTGDLSEKALGWATYAGDHIAMYDVNVGVPKTLIRLLIRWVANERATQWSSGDGPLLRRTLFDILDTPISPELLPAHLSGEIAQLTEAAIGPYELHDFFLYHLVRHGARPTRILLLAEVAFAGRYALPELQRWLRVFLQRFFASQFKRSCTADGPKVGMVALSPRGDWRMPSDASPRGWLAEVEAYGAGDTRTTRAT
ncbi:MAG: NAD(+) synthase [Proteobacteria bacterium]|nr:NAD(+) synthase [Pseudomonadota bacterium]